MLTNPVTKLLENYRSSVENKLQTIVGLLSGCVLEEKSFLGKCYTKRVGILVIRVYCKHSDELLLIDFINRKYTPEELNVVKSLNMLFPCFYAKDLHRKHYNKLYDLVRLDNQLEILIESIIFEL